MNRDDPYWNSKFRIGAGASRWAAMRMSDLKANLSGGRKTADQKVLIDMEGASQPATIDAPAPSCPLSLSTKPAATGRDQCVLSLTQGLLLHPVSDRICQQHTCWRPCPASHVDKVGLKLCRRQINDIENDKRT